MLVKGATWHYPNQCEAITSESAVCIIYHFLSQLSSWSFAARELSSRTTVPTERSQTESPCTHRGCSEHEWSYWSSSECSPRNNMETCSGERGRNDICSRKYPIVTLTVVCFQTVSYRKWQDYVYIQCEYKSTKQKIKHLLREENKVKENKIS